jgi:hypothetical protein
VRIGRGLTDQRFLILILVASAAVRFVLAWRGGARYFVDETRYVISMRGLLALGSGNVGNGLELLMLGHAHQLFPMVALIPAAIHAAAVILIGWPLLDYRIASALFSLFSVALIALIYALARRACADETEALFAAALGALANSLFYFSRHLMPYDASLALGLSAFLLAMKKEASLRTSLLAGVLSGLCVLVYNGYYTVAALAAIAHAFGGWPDARRVVNRCFWFACGAFLPICILLGVGVTRDIHLVESMRRFSGTINQGEYSEGWTLPFAYFWHAEHSVAIVWALACLAAVALVYRRTPGAQRAALWLAAALAVYVTLAIASTGLHAFVVYGRSVRPMVPFLCLVTAFVLRTLHRQGRFGQIVTASVFSAVAAAACLNFATPLALTFPQQVSATVRRQYGAIQEQSSCSTVDHYRLWYIESDIPVDRILDRLPSPLRRIVYPNLRKLKKELAETVANARSVDTVSRYVLLNAETPFFEHPMSCGAAPEGRVLRRWAHPSKYAPYQYEGATPEVRAWFRALDYQMMLVQLQ